MSFSRISSAVISRRFIVLALWYEERETYGAEGSDIHLKRNKRFLLIDFDRA
jgi:hypothetical protein